LTERGIPVLIVDTLRTEAEHHENLKKGTSSIARSKHLPRHLRMACTETDPNRNKSDAMDIAPYEIYLMHGADKLNWDSEDPVWKVIGECVEASGLVWGGRWRIPHDPGHMELKTPS
jgi:hypothetical protein